MELLVVRHAVAEDKEAFARTGKDDADRPLTDAGRRKFERGARGLVRLVKRVEVLATSPLVRAVQTGDVLESAYGKPGAVRVRELSPGSNPAALVPWLRRHRARSTVAVVGHEPHLSQLVEYLLVGRRRGFLQLRKGGACLLRIADPQPGQAELRWLLTGAQLRRLR